MKNLLYVGNKLAIHGNTPSSVDILPDQLRALGFKVVAVSSKRNKLVRLCDMLWTIYSHRKTIDVILIDTYSTQNFYFAIATAWLARHLKTPYMPILRGGKLPERLTQSPKLAKKLFGDASLCVVPSMFLYEIFQAEGFTNLKYLPNTIKIKDYDFTHRFFEVPKLLWVRSFSTIYNPKLAIDVYERTLLEHPNAMLTMVGPDKDGSLLDCKSYAEEKNLNVNFTGKLTKMEWRELSKDYNIFINTTNFDNTPVSVIEAMALGLVIVSTNVGGLRQLIKHSHDGILVPPKNVESFTNAVDQLIGDHEKCKMLTEAARKKVETFDWDIVKEDWCRLFA